MALQQSARNRRTRGDAARWLLVAACGASLLGGALASCANGGPGADGPGEDSGTGADVTQAGQDSGRRIGGEDATSPGLDTGAPDGGVGPPPTDSSLEATDAVTVDGAPPVETGGGTDASGTDASGIDASGIDASGIDASGTDASGTDASGTDASGTDASGTDASGTDASGTQDAATCGGWPQWFAGTTAQQVQHLGERYTCIQPGWCDQSGTSAVLAWEPGVGSDWQAAWKDSGPCP